MISWAGRGEAASFCKTGVSSAAGCTPENAVPDGALDGGWLSAARDHPRTRATWGPTGPQAPPGGCKSCPAPSTSHTWVCPGSMEGCPEDPWTHVPPWRGSVPQFSFLMEQESWLLPERSQGSSSPEGTCSPLCLSLRGLTGATRLRDCTHKNSGEISWHWKVLTFYGFSVELVCSCSVLLFLDGVMLLRGSSGPQAPSSTWLIHLHVPPKVALGKVSNSWVISGVRLCAESRPFFGLNLPTFISSNLLLQIQAQSPFPGSVTYDWSPGLLPRLSGRVLFWVRKPPLRIRAGFTAQFFLDETWLPASVVSNVHWVFPGVNDSSHCWQEKKPRKGCGRPSWRGGCPEMPDAPLPGPSSSQTTDSSQSPRGPGAAAARRGLQGPRPVPHIVMGNHQPMAGVTDDFADWQVGQAGNLNQSWVYSLESEIYRASWQDCNLNKISRLQSLNFFFLFFMCNFTSVYWRGGRFSKKDQEYTLSQKSTGRGSWEKRPSFSGIGRGLQCRGATYRGTQKDQRERSVLSYRPNAENVSEGRPQGLHTESLECRALPPEARENDFHFQSWGFLHAEE